MKNYYKNLLIQIWRDSARHNNETLASFVEPGSKLKVLDIGVDDGSMILERLGGKVINPRIYGVDIERRKIIRAKKRGVTAVKADAQTHLPFKDNYFDIVSANQIIEHLSDLDTFISEIRRVLKPKGYLLIATENLSSWHNVFSLIMGWQAFSQHISRRANIGNPLRIHPERKNLTHTSGMHIKVLTAFGLKELIKLYGLKIERFYGAGYYPFPPPFSRIFSRIDPTHSVFIGLRARKI